MVTIDQGFTIIPQNLKTGWLMSIKNKTFNHGLEDLLKAGLLTIRSISCQIMAVLKCKLL